jgi:hypothetical protein
MKAFEARQAYNPSEQKDENPGVFEFSLETEAGGAEQELYGNRRTLAKMLIRNPAFKSEKAQRALDKLRETWVKAEENLPEELKNELRHEHRDASTQDPVHISSIIADAPTRQPGLASMIQPQSDTSDDTDTDVSEESPGTKNLSIYRQAIIAGFTSALVIVFVLFLLLS